MTTTIENWHAACAVTDEALANYASGLDPETILALPGVLDAVRPHLEAEIRERRASAERAALKATAETIRDQLHVRVVTDDPVANVRAPIAVLDAAGSVLWACWSVAQLDAWAERRGVAWCPF